MEYTIDQVRNALSPARGGNPPDGELGDFAAEVVGSTPVYRVTEGELAVFAEDRPDLSDAQQEAFMHVAKRYIKNSDNFGEALRDCLDAALADARAA